MRRRYKWSIIGGAAFVGLLLLGVVVISWISGQALLHPDREHPPYTPSSVGLNWTWANFTTEDHVPIVGWFMPADASPRDNATVLFLHGYGDSKNQSLQTAPFLHQDGYNVFAFDFRAQGDSGGAYATAGILEVRDARAALSWWRNQTGVPQDPKVVLFGWSMGGATAVSSAPQLPEVDAVIADGCFSRLQNIVDTSITHFIKKEVGVSVPRWPIGPLSVQFAAWSVGLDLEANEPVKAIGKIHRPILLIQGTHDTTVTSKNLDELVNAEPNAHVLEVADAKHVESFHQDPVLYERTVTSFLRDALAPAVPNSAP